ncbi:MAG: MaoC/PaaZ C-terminal domain-containing protein [Bryobacteraceae bacterium]|nr:MaoC/PaaZ C-terminal domain-containing protein [Bryobacteraceae bacterium]
MSLHYEQFELGATFSSRGRTITEADIVQFAGLTGDYIEIHTNVEYAKAGPFGQRIAHGAMIFSYSLGLMTQLNLLNDTVIAFYGLDKLRFTRPVFIGDTIEVAKKVVEKTEKQDGGLITFETTVLNQRGETVVFYIDKMLIRYAHRP